MTSEGRQVGFVDVDIRPCVGDPNKKDDRPFVYETDEVMMSPDARPEEPKASCVMRHAACGVRRAACGMRDTAARSPRPTTVTDPERAYDDRYRS